MIKFVLKRVGVIVAAALFVAGALYALSPWLVSTLLSAWLQNHGAYSVSLDAGRPGLSSIRFAKVRGRMATESARYGLAASDVTVSYRIGDVLRGHLRSIRIAQADLSYDANGALQARDLALLLQVPGPWIRELGLDSAAVDALTVRFGGASDDAPYARLSGSLAADGESLSGSFDVGLGEAPPQAVSLHMDSAGEMLLQVRGGDGRAAPPWLTLRSSRAGGATALRGSLDARAEAATAALAPMLPAGDWSAIEGEARGEWDLMVPTAPSDWLELLLNARGKARMRADLHTVGEQGAAPQTLQGEFVLNAGDRELMSSGSLQADSQLPLRIMSLLRVAVPWPPGLDGSVSLNWKGAAAVADVSGWSAFLNNARLEADSEIVLTGTGAKGARIATRLELADARVQSQGTLQGDAAKAAELVKRWAAEPGWVTPSGQVTVQWTAAGPVSIPSHPDGWIGVVEADASASGDLELDRIDGIASGVSVSGDAHAALRSGRLSLRAEPGFRVTGVPDPAWLPAMAASSAPLTVAAPGALNASISVHARRYRLSLAREAELEIKDLVLGDVGAPSLRVRALEPIELVRAGDGPWTYDSVSLLLSSPVVFANLNAVGPMEALRGELLIVSRPGASKPLLTFRDLGLSMLGGRVESKRFEYDETSAGNELSIDVSGIDLGRVLRLEQQQGLQATGRIDGRVSLLLGERGVISGSGRVASRSTGGVIRYQPDAEAQRAVEANPGLKFAHQALGNLRYDSLQADADYGGDGDLKLRVQIEGVNPEWRPDQPIHLNLNLQENVPKLLQSLRISDDFTRVIEKRVEEFYRKGGAAP
jgi:hypothetical protein